MYVSHSATSKKVSMRLWWICVWVDSYVFCRWLNCSNFEKLFGGNIHVHIERGNVGIERCSKKAMLDTLHKPSLCHLRWYFLRRQIYYTYPEYIIMQYNARDLISCCFFILSQSIPQSQNIAHWIQEHGLQMVAPPKSSSEVREKIYRCATRITSCDLWSMVFTWQFLKTCGFPNEGY